MNGITLEQENVLAKRHAAGIAEEAEEKSCEMSTHRS